jgi:hypothetical protein
LVFIDFIAVCYCGGTPVWVLGESWIIVRRMTRKGPSRIMRSLEGLDDGNIEEKGTSILVRGIKNS